MDSGTAFEDVNEYEGYYEKGEVNEYVIKQIELNSGGLEDSDEENFDDADLDGVDSGETIKEDSGESDSNALEIDKLDGEELKEADDRKYINKNLSKIAKKIGRVTKIDNFDISNYPHRLTREFFVDRKEKQLNDGKLNSGESVMFRPVKVVDRDDKAHDLDYYSDGLKTAGSKPSQFDYSYKLLIWGALTDGRKALLRIDNYKPFFYIIIPTSGKSSKSEYISDIFNENIEIGYGDDTHIVKVADVISSYRIEERYWYQAFDMKTTAIRLEFHAKKYRSKCISALGALFTVAEDDFNIIHMVSRTTKLKYCQWMKLRSPFVHSSDEKFLNSVKSVRSSIVNISVDSVQNIENIEYAEDIEDKSLVMSWDIEVNFPNSKGATATIDLEHTWSHNDVILFMVCANFFWRGSKTPICQVALVTIPCERKDISVMWCKNQETLLNMFGKLIGNMKPDFTTGYNDGNFDWPMVLSKLTVLDTGNGKRGNALRAKFVQDIELMEEYNTPRFSSSRYFPTKRIKIDAETTLDVRLLTIQSMSGIDGYACMRRILPKVDNKSLNGYLNIFGISLKEDMPIWMMFLIFAMVENAIRRAEGIPLMEIDESMHRGKQICQKYIKKKFSSWDKVPSCKETNQILDYCCTDASRVHQLLLKANLYDDMGLLADRTMVDYEDAIYRANGRKVVNTVKAMFSQPDRNLLSPSSAPPSMDEGKFPGAFVLHPDKGKISGIMPMGQWQHKWQTELKDDNAVNVATKIIKTTLNGVKKQVEHYIQEIYEQVIPMKGGSDMDEDYDLVEDTIDRYEKIDKKFRKIVRKVFDDKCDRYCKQFSKEYPIEAAALPRSIKDVCQPIIEWLTDGGRPISGLDFSSLYPSIIMGYNISPEKVLTKERRKDYPEIPDEHLHHVKFDYGDRVVEGYIVRHQNKLDAKNFGVFPTILNDLFQERFDMKKELGELEIKREQMLKTLDESDEKAVEEFNIVDRRFAYVNSSQKALKVVMNTFYGETGNKLSPLYNLIVSGGVTSTGQKSLKYVWGVVKRLACKVVYGDTDSLYIGVPAIMLFPATYDYLMDAAPEKIPKGYEKRMEYSPDVMSPTICKKCKYDDDGLVKLCNECWNSTSADPLRDLYFRRLIQMTFCMIDKIKTIVNIMLKKYSGTYFLKMAYEEVLFPLMLLGKKKYFGVAHVHDINLYPRTKDIFIRGLDHIKRGAAPIVKILSEQILERTMDIHNYDNAFDDVISVVEKYYESLDSYKLDVYAKDARIRPNKQNATLLKMQDRLIRNGRSAEIPKNLEKFKYVVIDDSEQNGGVVSKAVGDRAELLEYAERHGLKIDNDYILKGAISGIMARFTSWHPTFTSQVPQPEDDTKAALKKYDEQVTKIAKKFFFEKFRMNATAKQIQAKNSAVNKIRNSLKKKFKIDTADQDFDCYTGGTKEENDGDLYETPAGVNKAALDIGREKAEEIIPYIIDKAIKDKTVSEFENRSTLVKSRIENAAAAIREIVNGQTLAKLCYEYRDAANTYKTKYNKVMEVMLSRGTIPVSEIHNIVFQGMVEELREFKRCREEVNDLCTALANEHMMHQTFLLLPSRIREKLTRVKDDREEKMIRSIEHSKIMDEEIKEGNGWLSGHGDGVGHSALGYM
jgi:DNA polymerase elongation subunit (family B)